MILFLGDSFTWGQGLQYIHLVENEGWSWDDCSKIIPPNSRMEWLGFTEDEYRKQNSFPHIVSKKIDLPYSVARFENGGDNETMYQILSGIQPFISVNNIFCLIIQFSDPVRSLNKEYDENIGDIYTQIKNQVVKIDEFCKLVNLPWLGISWQPEIGDILKEYYNENYIPIIYKNKEYTNFSYISDLKDIFLQETYPIEDGHFNLEGHKLMADMIYRKMLINKQIREKLIYYKETIKKTVETDIAIS